MNESTDGSSTEIEGQGVSAPPSTENSENVDLPKDAPLNETLDDKSEPLSKVEGPELLSENKDLEEEGDVLSNNGDNEVSGREDVAEKSDLKESKQDESLDTMSENGLKEN